MAAFWMSYTNPMQKGQNLGKLAKNAKQAKTALPTNWAYYNMCLTREALAQFTTN